MTVEQALIILETALQRRLSRIEELVFCHVWVGLSYSEIAAKCGYDVGYLKNVGYKLWRTLSNVLEEKVTKNNVQSVLKQRNHHPSTVIAFPLGHQSKQTLLSISPPFAMNDQ